MQEVTLDELKTIIENSKDGLWEKAQSVSREPHVYLHWSACNYDQFFDDYHINISKDGKYFVSTNDLSEILAHTWRRNTGAVGVALACGHGATTNDLGDEPPTSEQIESMAVVVAWLCNIIDIPCDKQHVMTHGEAANNEDGVYCHPAYAVWNDSIGDGDNRWDLEYLGTNESPSYNPYATDGSRGGDIERGKGNFYLNQIRG